MPTLDAETQQYIETALWSSHEDDGTPLDANYGLDDLAPAALEYMRADVADFLTTEVRFTQAALDYWRATLGEGQIGHDFWLTRNGHGAGFWDRFMTDPGASYGRQLTEQAKPYGSCDLYVGDDGRVYVA